MSKRSRIRGWSLATVIVATSGVSGAAYAQDGAPAATSGIEDIVVTARKTAESAQSVPMAITAFSQEGLERQNVLNVQDLQNSVTGLFIAPNSQGGAPTFAIRAAKADNGTSQTVTTYINDMPTTTTLAIANMVYDMQSISTLKGPQGTLFGANSTGGAIIFRPNQPSEEFEGYLEGGIGNFDRRYLEGMINVPVGEALQLRLAGNLVRRDGTTRNVATDAQRGRAARTFNDQHYESLRFSAKFTPSDRIQNDLMVGYFNRNENGASAVAVAVRDRFDYRTFLGFSVPVDYAKAGLTASPNWRNVQVGPNPTYAKSRIWDVTNTTSIELSDNVTAKLALGYEHADLDTFESSNSTIGIVVNGRTKDLLKQYTVEPSFDFTGVDGRLRIKVGAFYSDLKRRTTNSYGVIGLPFDLTSAAIPPGVVLSNFYPLANVSSYNRDLTSKAIYSQWAFDITDTLTATLGARYTWDKGDYLASNRNGLGLANVQQYLGQSAFQATAVPCAGGLANYKNFDPVACTGTQDYKTSSPSFTAVLEKEFRPGVMAYATARTGYLVGGFNNQVFVPGNFGQVFKPEKVLDGEVGIKADWELAGRPIRTNFDVFAGRYTNQQRVQNGTTANGTTFIAVQNAGKSHFYGTDVEITYDVADSLQLTASYQYVRAVYDEFLAPLNIPGASNAYVDFKGEKLSQTPPHIVNLSATYTLPFAEEYGEASLTATYFWRASTTGHDSPTISGPIPVGGGEPTSIDFDFTQYDKLPSYGLINLSLNWDRVMGSNFDVRFWAKNLANKKYAIYQSNQMLQYGYATYNFGNPREIGLNVRYSF